MKLSIKPVAGNKYEKRALLIKGASPVLWLSELEALKVNVTDIEAFAIPSDKANELYGCLLVFRKELPKDTRNHACFHCAYNKFLIPGNAALYPQLTSADLASVKAKWVAAHPDFGFVNLETPVDWLDLIAEVPETAFQVRQPLEGIVMTDKILGYSVEMDEEDMAAALLPPKTEEEWMKDLPFNLKKVLNGNRKEAEKYLQYLAKYPDRALALGIPLNVMNTSRDKGWASLNFRSGWLQSMFGGGGTGGSSGGSGGSSSSGRRGSLSGAQYLKLVLACIGVFFLLAKLLNTRETVVPAGDIDNSNARMAALSRQYDEALKLSRTPDVVDPVKDTLEKKSAALRSKYIVAVYKSASREVQLSPTLKDSMRLQVEDLERQISKVSDQIATRDAAIRKANLKKVETELSRAEKKLGPEIRDSIAKLPEQQAQSAAHRDVLYQSALANKKERLRDSLELAYGLRTVQQGTSLTASSAEFPDYEAQTQQKGIAGQVILTVFFFLLAVFVFTKLIRGKTISMGGRQLSFGMKALLLLAFIGLLVYIVYPLIDRYGFNWSVWFILLAAAALCYRLLASDKTILKSDKNG